MKIPVIFQNVKGYDSHFIIQEIGEIVKNYTITNNNGEESEMNINIIPNNMEKYTAFMIVRYLKFIDSFQFMNSNVKTLVSTLDVDKFYYTSKIFKRKRLI